MVSWRDIKDKARYFLLHVPRTGVDVLRSEGAGPLLAKVGRYIGQITGSMKGEGSGQGTGQALPPNRERAPGDSPRADYYRYMAETTAVGKEHVPISYPGLTEPDIRLIAFYLPQFHPIPENDEWWGKGFTEWTNVTRSVPQFMGHYQPRLPGELGFYDLRLREVQRRQVELAMQYGLHGFCFHFYWFGGRRLLETPLEQYLADPEIDFPFCINWANENWSRRWDGLDAEILVGQDHSPEDDTAFIEHVSRYMLDPRYIRVDGKPLLLVYRLSLLPEPAKTAHRWRQWCRENGVGEIYLALTHSFEPADPSEFGFDAAVEFAPNTFKLKDISHRFEIVNDEFQGRIFEYGSAADFSRAYRKPSYTKFRGICPSWDNNARRQGRGVTLAGSTPALYKDWLRHLCEFTAGNFEGDERIVFVNAWNEWAEGAYLEPDRKFGYAYLDATAEVLSCFQRGAGGRPDRWKALFVAHDANVAGAQAVFLGLVGWLRRHTRVDVKVMCLSGGPLLPRLRAMCDTLVLSDIEEEAGSEEELARRVLEFCGGRPDLVYTGSVAVGPKYGVLKRLGAPVVTHFHEMEMSIRRYASGYVGDVIKSSAHFLAGSGAVMENLARNHGVDRSDVTVVYESVDPDRSLRVLDDKEKAEARKRLGLAEDRFTVFGCGMGMPFRKGADLFLDTARALLARGVDGFQFCWIGEFDKRESDELYGSWAGCLAAMNKDGLGGHVAFLGFKDNIHEYFLAGDAFLLTSREDPLPLVVHGAAECGLPVVCFSGAGGAPEFVGEDAGFAVPFGDVEAMADKVALLMEDRGLRKALGDKARERLLTGFTFEQNAPRFLSACRKAAGKKPAVSVIVPNYNHAMYLPERLDSIFNQTFRDFEVILLDDASADGSVDVLKRYTDRADVRLVVNSENSGSSFRQWMKGIDMAEADILWIAESDDSCSTDFLDALLPCFGDPSVMLAYSDSHVMDEQGRLGGGYSDCEYLTSLSQTKWRTGYKVTADREVRDGLGVKNTVLNVSSALYRRPALDGPFREALGGMRIAGDWYFAARAIMGGKVHYESRRLNYHRRHSQSVIGKAVSDKKVEDFFREFCDVQRFIFDNYKLDGEFEGRWEGYLRRQWDDFYPGRPFEEIAAFYPVEEMRGRIARGR
ncbi:MAG: glycoside hydrolase family 99-like domain-containing protein [Nitrospirae bacterium]|nr:glycoside hydrolase family 99-like domain-containing protein [Nitrospirota bacterium]